MIELPMKLNYAIFKRLFGSNRKIAKNFDKQQQQY